MLLDALNGHPSSSCSMGKSWPPQSDCQDALGGVMILWDAGLEWAGWCSYPLVTIEIVDLPMKNG